MRKILFITILALMLTLSVVMAATTLSSLTLQANSGASASGTVTATSDGETLALTLTSSNLVSGINTISSSDITIVSLNNPQDSLIQEWTVTVDVPSGQTSGTYTGTLTLTENGTTIATSFITIIVNNIVQGEAFTLSDIEFGSNNQRREETITSSLRIENTGTESLTISLSSTVPSQYSLVFSQNIINLASGVSVDIPVTLYVPDDQDSGRKSIGTISAMASYDSIKKISNVYLETKSELVITKVKVDVDGKSETLDDDEEFDTKPGDDVTITITLKNEFDDNIDIEDINIELSSDSDLDWDDDTDLSRIKDGNKEDIEFSFTVPSDIDEDTYDIDIHVEGEDENGAMHEYDYTITANVERKNHEITIQSVSINPTRISCGGRVTLRVNVENTGSNDEDDVTIAIENDDLNLAEYFKRISLDEGDDIDKSLSFDVPSNAQVGEYIIDISAYYDSRQTDFAVVSLYVDSCGSGSSGTGITGTGSTGSTGAGTTTTPPVIIPTGTIGPSVGTAGFLNSTTYMIILVAAILLLLILIILLLVKFVF